MKDEPLIWVVSARLLLPRWDNEVARASARLRDASMNAKIDGRGNVGKLSERKPMAPRRFSRTAAVKLHHTQRIQ